MIIRVFFVFTLVFHTKLLNEFRSYFYDAFVSFFNLESTGFRKKEVHLDLEQCEFFIFM